MPGLIKIQDTGGDVASEIGQQWPQPVGIARSSSSKFISLRLRRVLLGVSTSGVFFLDHHTSHQPDLQYWEFSGTGCSLITELKVWSCESWTCLSLLMVFINGYIIQRATNTVAYDGCNNGLQTTG